MNMKLPRPAAGNTADALARIEAKLDALEGMVQQAEGAFAMAVDFGDEIVANEDANNRDVHDRVTRAAKLLRKLSEKETLEALEQLVEMLPMIQELPNLAAIAGDTFDSYIGVAENAGIRVGDTVASVVDSGALRTDNITFFADTAATMAEVHRNLPASKHGVFSLLGLLKDPDVQRTLGFAVEFAKAMGKNLDEETTTLALR